MCTGYQVLDLTYLEPTEPGVNWWIISMTEEQKYCGSEILYLDAKRICTRGFLHEGPHVSGRIPEYIYDEFFPPIYWNEDKSIRVIWSIDYAAYELY
jgi:hypothetical protein